MKDLEWWYDQSDWPGPPDLAWKLPWDDPMSDPRSAIQRLGENLFKPVVLAFEPFVSAVETIGKVLRKADIGAGRVYNHLDPAHIRLSIAEERGGTDADNQHPLWGYRG